MIGVTTYITFLNQNNTFTTLFGNVFFPSSLFFFFFFSSLSLLTGLYTFSFYTPARARNSRVCSSAELAERAHTTCHRRLLCLSSPFVPSPLTCIATGAADIGDLMLLRCMCALHGAQGSLAPLALVSTNGDSQWDVRHSRISSLVQIMGSLYFWDDKNSLCRFLTVLFIKLPKCDSWKVLRYCCVTVWFIGFLCKMYDIDLVCWQNIWKMYFKVCKLG